MFLPTNLVYRLAHMLHDVEAVIDDLVCRIGYVLNCSLEVRFPHVHGHGLDALELLRRELLVIILQAFGLAILSHKFHSSAEQVPDYGHVVMTFAKGLFIDARYRAGVAFFLACPRRTARSMTFQASSQLIRMSWQVLDTVAHSRNTSMTKRSMSKVNVLCPQPKAL